MKKPAAAVRDKTSRHWKMDAPPHGLVPKRNRAAVLQELKSKNDALRTNRN